MRQAAVGMAVLDEFERLDLLKNAYEVGRHLERGLAELASQHPIIGNVLKLRPPLPFSRDNADHALEVIDACLKRHAS